MKLHPPIVPENLVRLCLELAKIPEPSSHDLVRLQRRYPNATGYYKKTEILAGIPEPSAALLKLLTVKPVRTLSGVTPVTVLTKPYPCPGECIFCPSDVRMPKSYLSDEPGAQRAANSHFDPYLQAYNRLDAFKQMGHVYDKIELLVLGGTWSVYPLPYRIWFIKRLFQALNDFGEGIDGRDAIQLSPLPEPTPTAAVYNQTVSTLYPQSLNHQTEIAIWDELEVEQRRNETGVVRCVGLVLETRPDYITPQEVMSLRHFGATKIQLGIQSLQDSVLKANKRGHTAAQSAAAMALLRSAGFKLHVHWMPNLSQSSVAADKADYDRLFADPRYRPDEIKIYPCSLIDGTELMKVYQAGKWQPYTREQLLDVVGYSLVQTPRYCRITRVVRDIPSGDIVTGNKSTNFRQIAETAVKVSQLQDIRSREVRNHSFTQVSLKDTVYDTSVSTEHFLEFVTANDRIVAFLRLSLPLSPINRLSDELNHSALIREVHVYGQAIKLGSSEKGAAQHSGLGKRLISEALKLAQQAGFSRVAVISAVGTREYYRHLGFIDGKLYQHYEF